MADGGPSEAVRQLLEQAGNSARQSSGNPMSLGDIPGNIGKGFSQGMKGFDKVSNHSDDLMQVIGGFMDKLAGKLEPFNSLQTVDSSPKVGGSVMTAPQFGHNAVGLNKGDHSAAAAA